jgi:acyl carrier protein
MSQRDLRAELFTLLRAHVHEPVQIGTATSMCGELGLNSVELMEIAAEIEDHFGVRLPDEILPELETVGDMLRAVELRMEVSRRVYHS